MAVQNSIPAAVIEEFIGEAEELIQKVTSDFGSIEKKTHTKDTLDSVYRAMHTIKGSAQLCGFSGIGDVAHAMETSLDPIRRSGREIPPSLMEALYQSLDLVESMVKALRTGETDFSARIQVVIPKLIEASLRALGSDILLRRETVGFTENLELKAKEPESAPIPVAAETLNPKAEIAQPVVFVEKPKTEIKVEVVTPPAVIGVAEVKNFMSNEIQAPVPTVTQAPTAAAAPSSAANEQAANDAATLRVPVSLLDKLMVLMGEMVLVRNQVLQYSSKSDDLAFLNLSQRLDLVTSELQGEVMKTRMQPIGNVVTKFQRVVRDLSRDLGKKMELTLQGMETELDKTLLEAVKDPLTHIVRNCCDHGLEPTAERLKAGKSETGTVTIRAFHEGGQVLVEVSDDGRGLNKDKLLAKALEKGIIAQDKIAQMSERDIYNLIFAPGFSTAAAVTNVSGRGVGMDVVKSNIERIGGQAEILTVLGKGMTVRLKIPLTLAIVPAMIIKNGGERFAIPQVKLVELVRVDQESSNQKVEMLQGQPMYRLRGELLPLVHLGQVLGQKKDANAIIDGITNIVVLNAEAETFGLIVDEIQDTADIVVKPLSQFLKSLETYSGATVLGDGSVALILDVIGLAQLAKLTSHKDSSKQGAMGATNARTGFSDAQELLLFKINAPGKYALPLNLVHRLEEFNSNQIEFSGEQKVVRYRGSVLPIFSLNRFLSFSNGLETREQTAKLSVVVTQRSGKFYGVEVDDILDILSVDSDIDDSLKDRPGILGNMISNNEVIVIVDLLHVVEQEAARVSQKVPGAGAKVETGITDFNEKRKKHKILFAEDTAFFRRQVSKVLEKAGYEVSTANDGAEAFKRMESAEGEKFSLVLSDIEMPKMTGLELAQSIRKTGKFNTLPLIALTTKFSDRALEAGKAAGFNCYLEKMKAEELLKEMDKLLIG